jgi:nucleotide-binding universal stress UspA family protein
MSVPHDTQVTHETSPGTRDQGEGSSTESTAVATPLTEPLSALETARANAEAIERAPQTSEAVSEARRRGRIEAETRRISEEMTQQAQERRRAEKAQVIGASPAATAGLSAETAIPSGAAYPLTNAAALRPVPGSCQFKRLLAPLDGSFYAERALPYVTALARLTDADLLLGYVRLPSLPAPAQVVNRTRAELFSHEREPHTTDIQTYLDAQRVLQAFHAPTISVETVEHSAAAAGVLLLAEQNSADVVALATHARLGVERQIVGSTVDAVLARSHPPLLIIPPHASVRPEPSFKQVLLPLDGSPLAEHALGVLLGLIQASARSHVAYQEIADWQITLFTAIARRALMVEAFAYLDEVEARLRAHGLPQEARISKQVRLGSARGAILAAANHGAQAAQSAASSAGAFDLLVLATHGRGGLGRLIYGSVARYVLLRVAVPVLLAHPAGVEGRGR